MNLRKFVRWVRRMAAPDPSLDPKFFEQNAKSPAAYREGYRAYGYGMKNPHVPGTDMHESWQHGNDYAELQDTAW